MSEPTINPAANVTHAADANAIAILDVVNNWNSGITVYGVSDVARDALLEAKTGISNAVGALRGADEEAQRWLANKDIYPEGRQERANAAREAGQAAANEALNHAEAHAAIAEAVLTAESAPEWGSTTSERNGAQQLARADTRMLLDGIDGKGLADALQMLAQQDSPLSTLVTSDWLSLYLASRGVKTDEIAAMRTLATEAALKARADRGVKSAQLVFAMRRGIRGTLGATKALAANKVHKV
jgi:hypothetical protein